MPFRYSLILAALLVAGTAEGQSIVCPDVDFTYEVGPRVITLRWEDPPDSLRSRITLSLKKVGRIPCPFDSASGETLSCTAEDSISWRGTSLPTAGGSYVGGCDLTYRLRNVRPVGFFSTVDTARVPPSWGGTSLPVSGGTFRSCVDTLAFQFTVQSGGTIGPGGSEAVVGWREDSTSQSGTIVVPAGSTPGDLFDVANGMRVGFSAGTLVAGDTFTIRTRIPDAVLLEWIRPISEFEDSTDQVRICRPDTAVEIENGVTVSLSPGSLPKYSEAGDTVGVFRVRVETFDGFRVYRSDISALDRFAILREFNLCRRADSTFFELDERLYVDTEVHNGFPYRYYITCYDTLSKSESPSRPTPVLYPRTNPGGNVAEIHVVPNPYKRRAAWEETGEPKIQFVNVPLGATIRIYSSAGSLVREIGPDEVLRGCGASPLPGCVNWDLKNGQKQEVVSGIYIYQAEAPGRGGFVGKFMVAR